MNSQIQQITLQWHVTERCNLKCLHCYQEGYSKPELNYDQQLLILEQFSDFIRSLGIDVHGHINLTGGEPFVRSDFFDLLAHIKKHTHFSFSILTNGTLLTKEICSLLKELDVRSVQVSLDGNQMTHDTIRGEGQYKKALRGIRLLKKAKIRTLISFTAHRQNYRQFSDVASISRHLKVDRVWADRLIPHGVGQNMEDLVLTPEECDELFCIMKREQLKSKWYPFSQTEVALHRALQFQKSGHRAYRCSAGSELITIGAGGEVWPCRRMPIEIGNIKTESLLAIYTENDLLKRLRNRLELIRGCETCEHMESCNGGLKCLSHAMYGDPFVADYGCLKRNMEN